MIFHDSHNLFYRSPFGAAEVSSAVTLRITADMADSVKIRLWTDEKGEELREMQREQGDNFCISLKMPKFGTVIWYHFIVHYPSGSICMYGAPYDRMGGKGCEYIDAPFDYQITVYKPQAAPAWYKAGIMYQIFPDRFAKGSDFEQRARESGYSIEKDWYKTPEYIKDESGEIKKWTFYGGTLKGIEENIPYLKELGITTVYINPVFKARSNHRYDTADYMKIDPLLGTEEDFSSLCASLHENDIHIIFDGVYSHTGADSIYFKKGSPYNEWFDKTESGAQKYWWGVRDLPEVDETNPSYVKYICGADGVIHKWMNAGADGIRLDVADELPDAFIKEIRKRVKKEKADSVLIGEVWEDASNKESHGEKRRYLMGEELDGVMNYPLRSILIDYATDLIDANIFNRRVVSLIENYPKDCLLSSMDLLGSHDRRRILSVLFDHKELVMMLYKLMFAMPGVPCIYYGDEAGLKGLADPENRAAYPWGKEDKKMLSFFKELAKEYYEHPALADGDYEPVFTDKSVVSFIRKNENERVLVLANRNEIAQSVEFEGIKYDIPALTTIYRAL